MLLVRKIYIVPPQCIQLEALCFFPRNFETRNFYAFFLFSRVSRATFKEKPDSFSLVRAHVATYAIGDVQGCMNSLHQLIDKIQFDPNRDRLWFVGDLVNRGPDSLAVLRYVKSLGSSAVTVLGNHDLHLLAVSTGVTGLQKKDTFHEVLSAPDCKDLLKWLRHQPLIHQEHGFLLVHAGLLPQWTIKPGCDSGP